MEARLPQQAEQVSLIGVRVPQSMKAELRARARAEGVTLSHYAYRLLSAALEERAA